MFGPGQQEGCSCHFIEIRRDGLEEEQVWGRRSRSALFSWRTLRYLSRSIKLPVGYMSLELGEEFPARDINFGIIGM